MSNRIPVFDNWGDKIGEYIPNVDGDEALAMISLVITFGLIFVAIRIIWWLITLAIQGLIEISKITPNWKAVLAFLIGWTILLELALAIVLALIYRSLIPAVITMTPILLLTSVIPTHVVWLVRSSRKRFGFVYWGAAGAIGMASAIFAISIPIVAYSTSSPTVQKNAVIVAVIAAIWIVALMSVTFFAYGAEKIIGKIRQ